jgi:probable F420-dependent oxidoreductase
MDFGAVMFPTEYAIQPDELARALEERGFESLWLPEHTHIPVSRRSPWPLGPDLPREYWHAYDPFVALTAAAAATRRLRLATGVCLLVERDPIVTAKEVATLDRLSGGRFIFGIGGGWNAEEMEHHGTPFAARWRILRERVLAMKELWTRDEPAFDGEFVKFARSWAWPKPLQQPHPPILMGGNAPRTFDRVVEFCDGWMPIGGRAAIDFPGQIADLRRRAEQAGRDPRSIAVTVFAARPDPSEIERLGAIEGMAITPLGHQLRSFPLHPRLGRVLIAAGGAREAAAVCAWLSEGRATGAGQATTSCDLLPLVDRWSHAPSHTRQVADTLYRTAQGLLGNTARPHVDVRGPIRVQIDA